MLCDERFHLTMYDTPLVSLRMNELFPSVNAVSPLEKFSVGGPQFVGSWLLPVMPACPEMFARLSQYGVMRLDCRLNW